MSDALIIFPCYSLLLLVLAAESPCFITVGTLAALPPSLADAVSTAPCPPLCQHSLVDVGPDAKKRP